MQMKKYNFRYFSSPIQFDTLEFLCLNFKTVNQRVYGQATQDGYSLVLCPFLVLPVPASSTTYSQNWPSHALIPGPSWWLFSSKGQWGCAPLLVSVVTDVDVNSPVTGNLSSPPPPCGSEERRHAICSPPSPAIHHHLPAHPGVPLQAVASEM